jgi:hypothetical protein
VEKSLEALLLLVSLMRTLLVNKHANQRKDYNFFQTGSRDDFDYYARITGDKGWSWDATAKFRDAIQRFIPPANNSDGVRISLFYEIHLLIPPVQRIQYNTSAHASDGALTVQYTTQPTPMDDRVVSVTFSDNVLINSTAMKNPSLHLPRSFPVISHSKRI